MINKNFNLGVMQGRLLPKYKGRYQAHPLNYWKEEFYIAKQLNLNYIEFILDLNDYQKNPLIYKNGLNEIKKIIDDTNVEVKSICADIFMEIPFYTNKKNEISFCQKILIQLIENGNKINLRDIVIPFVDSSSLKNEAEKQLLVKNLLPVIEYAEKYNINISLETDLNPIDFLELLNKLPSNNIILPLFTERDILLVSSHSLLTRFSFITLPFIYFTLFLIFSV